MLKTLYPSLDLDTIKHALAGDKKNGTVTGRIEVCGACAQPQQPALVGRTNMGGCVNDHHQILLKLAEGDVELRPTTDLFIAALTIYKLEYELTGKKVPLPEILGVISESIQQVRHWVHALVSATLLCAHMSSFDLCTVASSQGTLQVLTRLATELRTSVLKMVQLKPHQVILQVCKSFIAMIQNDCSGVVVNWSMGRDVGIHIVLCAYDLCFSV